MTNSILTSLIQRFKSGKSASPAAAAGTALKSRRVQKMAVPLLYLFLILAAIGHAESTGQTAAAGAAVKSDEPIFVEKIQNVTVTAGRDVKLACVVENVGTYKIAWIAYDKSAILTVQEHVITRNPRINVTYDGYRTWTLHIQKVNASDAGMYMCQVNTIVAKSQFGYINVVVPPNIIDSESSGDVLVQEETTVTLRCSATGTPKPRITWRREDGKRINLNRTQSVIEYQGAELKLHRISRTDMAAFLCIAKNNVSPTVSKRIQVSVNFPPMMTIPHQLVGAPLDYSITLECTIEAYPPPLTYWTKNMGENMIHTSNKYRIQEKPGTVSYRTHMKLTIHSLRDDDFDSYKCMAKNSRGETEGTMKLYKSDPPTTTASTSESHFDTIFKAPPEKPSGRRKLDKSQTSSNGIPQPPSEEFFDIPPGEKQGSSSPDDPDGGTDGGGGGGRRRLDDDREARDGGRPKMPDDFMHNFFSSAGHVILPQWVIFSSLLMSVVLWW